MPRRFREHEHRVVTDLSGIWDFVLLGDVEPDTVDVGRLVYADRMAVPGCFDATPTYAGRRGLAAYRTWIVLRDSTPHRLIFDAVHHWCRVFVGGVAVRDHEGGFTRFMVDLVDGAPGSVEVVVLVDNRLDYARCPLHLDHFDWYHFVDMRSLGLDEARIRELFRRMLPADRLTPHADALFIAQV